MTVYAEPSAQSQRNAGPPQVSLTPAGGGMGAARPWGALNTTSSLGLPAGQPDLVSPGTDPCLTCTACC